MIDKPIKLVGDENNPANVVVEMDGSLQWSAKGGWIEGITFRRPKILSGASSTSSMVNIVGAGKIDVIQSAFDNAGSTGNAVIVSGTGNKGNWEGVTVRNGGQTGIFVTGNVRFKMMSCSVKGSTGSAVVVSNTASIELAKCYVVNNGGFGMHVSTGCRSVIVKCHFASNVKGVLMRETNADVSCSMNTAVVAVMPGKSIPGFKLSAPSSKGNVNAKT